MSTRGFIGFVIDGTEKITYNHSDSYPSWLGARMLTWLKGADLAAAATQARALRLVDDDAVPTAAEHAALAQHFVEGVGNGNDWYSLLRDTQGDPAAILACGVMIDGHDFALDSLFCEWGYLVDFDHATLEVYKGFQTEPHTEGRFGRLDDGTAPWEPSYAGDKRWFPVRRVALYSLERLPESLDDLEKEEAA